MTSHNCDGSMKAADTFLRQTKTTYYNLIKLLLLIVNILLYKYRSY